MKNQIKKKKLNKYIDKIGIEREYWLIDNRTDEVVEPALYGFPYDEFGFLVEIRTEPQTTPEALLKDFQTRFIELEEKAYKLNMHFENLHKRIVDEKFINRLSIKYHYNTLLDLTANIYEGTSGSHATGLDSGYGTAGLHIHFSRYTIDGKRVQLSIVKIVKAMDKRFERIIFLAGRNLGEFEIKVHGFEYRSLPADITLSLPIRYAFKILEECC
jgi:hypothetical protein